MIWNCVYVYRRKHNSDIGKWKDGGEMENIIGLFGAAGVLALVCIGIAVLLYPIMFEISFREHIGTSGISFWWTICQIIGILGTLSYAKDTTSDGFYEALGFTLSWLRAILTLVLGLIIIGAWQHFGNRKSVSQNKMCK